RVTRRRLRRDESAGAASRTGLSAVGGRRQAAERGRRDAGRRGTPDGDQQRPGGRASESLRRDARARRRTSRADGTDAARRVDRVADTATPTRALARRFAGSLRSWLTRHARSHLQQPLILSAFVLQLFEPSVGYATARGRAARAWTCRRGALCPWRSA